MLLRRLDRRLAARPAWRLVDRGDELLHVQFLEMLDVDHGLGRRGIFRVRQFVDFADLDFEHKNVSLTLAADVARADPSLLGPRSFPTR